MIETGEIKKVAKNGWCTVRFPRKTACENCNMCFKPKEEMFVELKLKNTLGAQEGDMVTVEIGDRAVISASFIVYLIPLALLGIALGVSSISGDLAISLGSAGAALIIGFAIVSFIDKKIKGKKGFSPKMTAIVRRKTAAQQTNPVPLSEATSQKVVLDEDKDATQTLQQDTKTEDADQKPQNDK